MIYNSVYDSNKKAFIVKINNRYHVLKPDNNKYTQLNNLLKQLTEKELSDSILRKIII